MRQILRDRRVVGMLIVAPILQLVVFGYAINMDVDRISTVVCDQDRTEQSRSLTRQFLAGRTFRFQDQVLEPEAAESALESGDAAVALIIPRGFALRLARRDDPQVQVLLNGTDSTRAQVAANVASQLLVMAGIGAERPVAPGRTPSPPLTPRILYNPTLATDIYMIPGILAALLIVVTAIIAAMGLAREREAGTLEQVLVTPIRPSVLLVGKCAPYVLFGFIDIMAILLIGSLVFEMPMRGSLAVVALGSFLYLFSTLGVGIVLATVSTTQQQTMLGAFSFMLPAMLLSGFVSPIETMPQWLQWITLLNPLRHFIEIARACFLKGAGLGDVTPQLLNLGILGVGLLSFAVFRFNKRIA
ncbi:MAG: ABC transporter permease [Deltaproteobacteria bacterium]|nr:ABC transporter permease [Deltaproteobacteria bacterium]